MGLGIVRTKKWNYWTEMFREARRRGRFYRGSLTRTATSVVFLIGLFFSFVPKVSLLMCRDDVNRDKLLCPHTFLQVYQFSYSTYPFIYPHCVYKGVYFYVVVGSKNHLKSILFTDTNVNLSLVMVKLWTAISISSHLTWPNFMFYRLWRFLT